MAWSQQGNIRGPQGDPGDDGRSAYEVAVDNGFVGTEAAWLASLQGPAGETGADGTSVEFSGSVANAGALPGGLGAEDVGTGYITQDDGHLHVWDGDSWNDVGEIRGPQGVKGDDGDAGPQGPRGATWFSGTGAPGTLSGQQPGDFYLDFADGTVYTLS